VQGPLDHICALMHREQRLTFPILSEIITSPLLLPDGRLIQERGYDEQTGILFPPSLDVFPPIPERPTEIKDARALLLELLDEFVFAQDEGASLAVAVSGFRRIVVEDSHETCIKCTGLDHAESAIIADARDTHERSIRRIAVDNRTHNPARELLAEQSPVKLAAESGSVIRSRRKSKAEPKGEFLLFSCAVWASLTWPSSTTRATLGAKEKPVTKSLSLGT
jgi:hypothetical protein